MNATAAALPAASRPKVHRPPPRAHRSPRHQLMTIILNYGDAAKFAFALSSLGLAIILAALLSRTSLFSGPESPLPPHDSEMAVSAPSTYGKTIILKDKQEMIIGQMAKMAPRAQAPADAAVVSDVDKRRRQELLSIVNQY